MTLKFSFHYFLAPLLALFLFMVVIPCQAQVYGNEWIEEEQEYFKIPVGKSGIYAIPFGQLSAAGVPSSFLSTPENLQLLHRGKEQAIHIQNDSLFFYGQQNDGTLDSLLYKPSHRQPHKYYNLYSDTTAYFLTWSPSVPGKRMVKSNVASGQTPDAYHFAETLILYTYEYERGYRYSSETYLTHWDQGEGWFSGPINGGLQFTPSVPFSNVYSAGPQAELEIMLVGKNGAPGLFNHKMEILIGNPASPDLTFTVPAFAFHDVKVFKEKIPLSSLSGSSMLVTMRNTGTGAQPSKVAVAYIKLTYPQTCVMEGMDKYFNTQPSLSSSAIEITNSSSGSIIFDITDKDNVKIVNSTFLSGTLSASLAPSVSGHKLYITSKQAYLSAHTISKVDFLKFSNGATADYLIISHRKIMTGAREYAAYRASGQGGAYDTLVVDVEKLYDMYAYGERTPTAIRRFIEHMFRIGDPSYLFIIGKGLTVSYNNTYRSNPGLFIDHPDPETRREDLVPCYGVPCTDLLYSTGIKASVGINGKDYIPALSTGRLAAKSNDEVRAYLSKVKENESTPNALWRKNFLHLSGGNSQYERTDFYNYMAYLKTIAEDTVYGGKVVRIFSKKGNDAVDNELISSVSREINKGVSYVTFLGHSAAHVTDLDIGFVSQEIYGYENKGKYPLLFINGCASALIFDRWSFAEDWILTPDKGAILTLGHTDAGYVSELKSYSTHFYKNAFQIRSNVGKPVGDVQIAAMKDFYLQYTNNNDQLFSIGIVPASTLHQMVIQGDPAVKIYRPSQTDYAIDDSKLSVRSIDQQKAVTALSDSFAIAIVVSNLGVDFGDSLKILVRRTVNGAVTDYGPVSYKDIKYQDTLLFVIRSKDATTYGENIFEVILDPANSIQEMDEFNNKATLRYFMPMSGVTALFPKEYSIVNSSPVTFISQSTNLLAADTDYFIELDTSYLFSSSALVRKSAIIHSGSLIKWENIPLPVLQDSLVYYWRVRYNDIPAGQDTLWGESSFIYIHQSPEGWSQSEFPQFSKDPVSKVIRDMNTDTWSFAPYKLELTLKTVGYWFPPSPLFPQPFLHTTVLLNGLTYEYRGVCKDYVQSLFALAFDKGTVLPYSPYGASEGGITCDNFTRDAMNFFNGLHDSVSAPTNGGLQNQSNLMEYIDRVKEGDYVVFGSYGTAYFENWRTELKEKFKSEFGAKYVDSLKRYSAYLLIARKGNDTPIFESFGDSISEIFVMDTLYGSHNRGTITSTLIGPAVDWGTFYRSIEKAEPSDSFNIKIIGVNLEGQAVDTFNIPQHDQLDLSTISGLEQYPYIRLYADLVDTAGLTPAQLKKWQVIFSGVPEGIMNPSLVGLNQYNPVVKPEGDSISVCYAFENISNYDFEDTLQVKYTITNSQKGAIVKTADLIKLKQDSVITFCHKFSTIGLEGNNILQAYVNPKILREEYYNNNIIEMSFQVETDKTHPILDVVFDGVHIMDGDIVSPSPVITVTLNDENKFLIRNSPENIDLFLQRPGQVVPQKIDLNSSDIIDARQVGTNGKNVYQIEYHPQNLPDGIYVLVVRGSDLSENPSGIQDYRISFEVINESAITHFYPYPNPFSTSTRFVFTLTGREVPEDMKIQIMTVSGKVVREITKAELGPIRIGNNKSEYAWDGRDEFGDKLANGVYLYRVVLKKGGTEFKHRESAGDKAFHKNFGKLYILR